MKSGKINGHFPFTVIVHQKHGEKNHCKCDRCINNLFSDTDISFDLFNLIYIVYCVFWLIASNALNTGILIVIYFEESRSRRHFLWRVLDSSSRVERIFVNTKNVQIEILRTYIQCTYIIQMDINRTNMTKVIPVYILS